LSDQLAIMGEVNYKHLALTYIILAYEFLNKLLSGLLGFSFTHGLNSSRHE